MPPHIRSLLSAAISAADHGYFDDATVLLRDALESEPVQEIAIALRRIERRDGKVDRIDLRPQLAGLFSDSGTALALDDYSLPGEEDELSDSELVIEFDDIPEPSILRNVPPEPSMPPAPPVTTESSDRIATSPSQFDTQQDRTSGGTRARYATTAPAPPPPTHRRTQRLATADHSFSQSGNTGIRGTPDSLTGHHAERESGVFDTLDSQIVDDDDDADFDLFGPGPTSAATAAAAPAAPVPAEPFDPLPLPPMPPASGPPLRAVPRRTEALHFASDEEVDPARLVEARERLTGPNAVVPSPDLGDTAPPPPTSDPEPVAPQVGSATQFLAEIGIETASRASVPGAPVRSAATAEAPAQDLPRVEVVAPTPSPPSPEPSTTRSNRGPLSMDLEPGDLGLEGLELDSELPEAGVEDEVEAARGRLRATSGQHEAIDTQRSRDASPAARLAASQPARVLPQFVEEPGETVAHAASRTMNGGPGRVFANTIPDTRAPIAPPERTERAVGEKKATVTGAHPAMTHRTSREPAVLQPPTPAAEESPRSGVNRARTESHDRRSDDGPAPQRREVLGGSLAPNQPQDRRPPMPVSSVSLPPMQSVLVLRGAAIQAARSRMNPRMMFLLDQIDGQSSIQDIIDVTGLPESEASALISQLLSEGLVEVRPPARKAGSTPNSAGTSGPGYRSGGGRR